MLPDLAIDVNDLAFVIAPNMIIEIRPDERLLPELSRPASEQPALVYLAGLSKSSQRSMWGALRVVSAIITAGECTPITIPWHLLRRQHVNAVRAILIENYSPATGKRFMAALRGVLKETWRLDLMSAEEYMKAIDVKAIRGSGPDQAAGRALSAGEIAALMNTCRLDLTSAGPRDAAIIGLGARCGLRRAEITGLQLGDWQGDQMVVFGKGRKTRTVYVGPGTSDALADWVHLRGTADGSLFLAIQNGRMLNRGITPAAIWSMLKRRARQSGVKIFSPHDLRRTFAGDQLDAGTDIATVQRIMGHASPITTAKYDRRGERAKREAAGRLHLPWTRRY